MGSFLETYGAEEAQRARRARVVKWSIVGVLAAALLAFILYDEFKDYTQEQIARQFLTLLRSRDYQDAYRMFGCTEATPCPYYAYPKFLEDWGPQSQFGDASKASLGLTQSCGNGVLIQITNPGRQPTMLIVERGTGQISFAPSDWPECPGRHWHFRQFFHRVFSRS